MENALIQTNQNDNQKNHQNKQQNSDNLQSEKFNWYKEH